MKNKVIGPRSYAHRYKDKVPHREIQNMPVDIRMVTGNTAQDTFPDVFVLSNYRHNSFDLVLSEKGEYDITLSDPTRVRFDKDSRQIRYWPRKGLMHYVLTLRKAETLITRVKL